ncbi:DUF4870 domain-containing protein [bacterium]|nr:DUF4870 domain-containing protein [bacterium]
MNDFGGNSFPPPDAPTPDEKTMGMLAHLLGVFTGFIGALIIWAIKKDESKYIAKQSMEALFFQIGMAALWLIVTLISVVTCGFGAVLYLGVVVIGLGYTIIATIKANDGLIYEYPFTTRFVNVDLGGSVRVSDTPPSAEHPQNPPPPQPPEE